MSDKMKQSFIEDKENITNRDLTPKIKSTSSLPSRQEEQRMGRVGSYMKSLVDSSFISDKAIGDLAHYRFHSCAPTPLEGYILMPQWEFLVKWVPRWVSPNMLTFTGFLGNLAALIFLLIVVNYYPDCDDMRKASAFLTAFSMWVYQTLDGMDGKHARNTKQSTPLGAIFDHCCDAANLLMIALLVKLTIYNPDPYHEASNVSISCFLTFVIAQTAFYLAQWEHYHTQGVLEIAGAMEGQCLAYSHVFLCAFNWFRIDFLFATTRQIMSDPTYTTMGPIVQTVDSMTRAIFGVDVHSFSYDIKGINFFAQAFFVGGFSCCGTLGRVIMKYYVPRCLGGGFKVKLTTPRSGDVAKAKMMSHTVSEAPTATPTSTCPPSEPSSEGSSPTSSLTKESSTSATSSGVEISSLDLSKLNKDSSDSGNVEYSSRKEAVERFGHPVLTLFPYYLHVGVCYAIYNSPIYATRTFTILCAIGANQLTMTLCSILWGVSNSKARYMLPIQVPYYLFGLMTAILSSKVFNVLGYEGDELLNSDMTKWTIISLIIFQYSTLLYLSKDIIWRICDFLSIPFLKSLDAPFNLEAFEQQRRAALEKKAN